MVPINYLAVLVSAIAAFVLGFLWHGLIFGKVWIRLSGFTEAHMAAAKAKGMTGSYILAFVGNLVMAYVLAHAVIFGSAYLNTTGVSMGLSAGFWNWIGFIAPVTLGMVLWQGKPWKLWLLNNGYYLLALLVMGII